MKKHTRITQLCSGFIAFHRDLSVLTKTISVYHASLFSVDELDVIDKDERRVHDLRLNIYSQSKLSHIYIGSQLLIVLPTPSSKLDDHQRRSKSNQTRIDEVVSYTIASKSKTVLREDLVVQGFFRF